MCGITGVALSDPQEPIDSDLLRRMTDIMRHRGPDSHGFYTAPGISLGVRRLRIVDLQTGDQPIANEDGTVTVVCNGEIYNFVELRQQLLAVGHHFRTHSDTEVIVHLYEDHGGDCLQHLRGMFGFALWDARRRVLMLARDRLGIKPLYYAAGKDAFSFASELKSILLTDCIERQVDVQALKDLFTLGFIVAPKTLFTKIRQLPPGCYLLYQNGNVSIHRYWDLRFPAREEEPSRMSAAEWAEALLGKLEESVQIHLRGDVPFGAWLSGGIDSSTVAGLMRRQGSAPIHTFTLTFEQADSDEVRGKKTLDEFPDYQLSGQRVGFKTQDFRLLPQMLWYCESPSTSGVEVPQMLLAQTTAEHVKVVLSGEGADELFGGYPWFHLDKLLRPLAKLPLAVRRFLLCGSLVPSRWPRASRVFLAPQHMNLARYQRMVGPDYREVLPSLFSADLSQSLGDAETLDWELTPPDDFARWHPFAQLQYYETKLRLPELITRQLDRSSMAHSVEARVPFLDHELVEFCAHIPPALKMHGLQEKYILRQAMQGILPPEIVRRKKRGLAAPFPHWLRGPLPDFAADLLSKKRLREKGYFNPDFVPRLLARHRAGQGDYGRLLFGVLTTQLWDDLFLQGRSCQDV
ncbi:MAG: asparagine synthase (glutamine-hydrolyzing) [Candidatus Binatia bacterium]